MNLNFPLPFYELQSDVSLRKEKDFNDFDFLLIMVFYAVRNKEISKNLSVKNAIKSFLNLDEKFLPFIEDRLKRLISNETVIYTKTQKINLDEDFVGYYEINETIAKNIDNNVFKGFDANNRETSYFLYKNLIPVKNWKIVRKNVLQQSDMENNYSLDDFDLKDFENELENSINSYVDFNESGYKVSNISSLYQNSKITLIDYPINIILKTNGIYPETNDDLELLENIYDFKKIDYLSSFISENLSLSKIFNYKSLVSKKPYNLKFSFSIFDDREINEIKYNCDLVNELISGTDFNYVFFRDEMYLVDIEQKCSIDLNIVNNKKIQVEIDFLNLFEIDKENQVFIFEKLIKFLDWKKVSEKLNKIPMVFQKYCYLSGLNILKNNIEKEETEKIKNVIGFLSKTNITFDNLENINLLQTFFDYNDFPKFLADLFRKDAKSQRKYENQFINFKIDENLQKQLNEIYEFNYLNKEKYFNVSAEETRLKNLKDFIKQTKDFLDKNKNNVEAFKLEEIYSSYEKLKKSFQWIKLLEITKDFDIKLNSFRNELFNLKNSKMKNIALSIRTLLEEKVALYGNFKQKDVNTDFNRCLKNLLEQKNEISEEEESKLSKDDYKYLLEARNKSNSCLHYSEESKDINISNIDQKINELENYYKGILQIIKGWKC